MFPPRKKAAIRNMRAEGQYVVLKPGEKSTHLMSSKGKEAFPTVFPKDKNTKSHDPKDWIDMPDTKKAYEEAKKRGEVVKFATKRRATKIAMGAWKKKEDNPFKGEFKKEAKSDFKKELKRQRIEDKSKKNSSTVSSQKKYKKK